MNGAFHESARPHPYCLNGAGCAGIPAWPSTRALSPRRVRGRGAPKGATCGLPPGGGARPLRRDASPSGAPRCGDFCPRGRASGCRFTAAPSEGPRATPAGFRPPSPAPVQPLKAEPRSGPGRLPAASRVRGYEPRPQAPPPCPTFSERLQNAPRLGQGRDRGILT